MAWFRDFGVAEVLFILLFVGLYSLYLFKLLRVARALNTSFDRAYLKLALRTIVFALLIIAFLGPSFGEAQREVKSVGKDIMICVDLSKSMDAFDVQPTRLEKVKFEMKRIVAAFNSDRLGIIIFSSEAFMQCPLTYDQNALNLFIETMNTSLVPSSGTDFGPPVKMALKKLTDEEAPSTQQKSKVIILISDGEDFGEETDEVVKQVQSEGIKLFTLGVGTTTGSQIYAGSGFKTDRQGNAVITHLNPTSLQTLATRTEGEYFEINETKNDISRLINTISRIEGELRDTRMVDVSANRYFYFLLVAVILIAMDTLINIKTVSI